MSANDSDLPKKTPGTPGQPPAKPGATPPAPGAGKIPVGKPATPGQPPVAGKPIVPGAGTPALKPTVPGQPPAKPAVPGQPAAKPVVPVSGIPAAKPAVPGQPPPKPGIAPTAGKPAVPGQPGAAPVPGKPATPVAAKPGATPAPANKPPAKPGGKPAVSASAHKPAPVKAGIASRSSGRRIGQVLVDLGYLDDDQLWEVLEEAKNAGIMMGQAAIARGLITELQLYQALAEQFNLKLLNMEEIKTQPEALTLVPETMASVYKVLPLTMKDGLLTVVVGDPNNLSSLDDLRNLLGLKEVQACLTLPSVIAEVMTKCYLGKEESIMDIISALQADDDAHGNRRETSIDLDEMMSEADAAPVRKLINMVMLLAIKDRASDIHFEPFEEEYKLRYRCDGVMFEMVPPPRHLAMAISTRIKVMSNLDIAERRLPQDGRIELNVGGNQIGRAHV